MVLMLLFNNDLHISLHLSIRLMEEVDICMLTAVWMDSVWGDSLGSLFRIDPGLSVFFIVTRALLLCGNAVLSRKLCCNKV